MSRGVKKIDLPKFEDRRGNLSFIEGGRHIPFDIRRAYWIYSRRTISGGACLSHATGIYCRFVGKF